MASGFKKRCKEDADFQPGRPCPAPALASQKGPFWRLARTNNRHYTFARRRQ
jgi:hypothetical protein